MEAYAQDLARWMPRLLAVFRRARKLPEGPDTLLPHELKEVAAGVRTLSLGLTRERQLAGARYMDDPRLLGAYLLFYWPISYAQGRQVFGELPGRARSVLDLGSGPGPLAFAALDAGATDVTAADRSRPALALAKELAIEAGEAMATREWDPQRTSELPATGLDAILLGHLLNELFGKGEAALGRRAALVEKALAALRPGGSVVLIEPALRDTSRELLQLRDVLVRRGFAVRAPCLFRGDCPALVKPTDWCHAERAFRMPPLLEQLARTAGLLKEALKMSYLILAPKDEAWREPPSGRSFRIVSEPLAGKGRQRFMGCGPEGRLGLALQDKHRSEGNAAFFRLQRGDVVTVTQAEPRGDGLALGEDAEVRIVAPAGRPVPPGQSG
jgi:ribosomal protein RSM22 (predicted rRNA methylase)